MMAIMILWWRKQGENPHSIQFHDENSFWCFDSTIRKFTANDSIVTTKKTKKKDLFAFIEDLPIIEMR